MRKFRVSCPKRSINPERNEKEDKLDKPIEKNILNQKSSIKERNSRVGSIINVNLSRTAQKEKEENKSLADCENRRGTRSLQGKRQKRVKDSQLEEDNSILIEKEQTSSPSQCTKLEHIRLQLSLLVNRNKRRRTRLVDDDLSSHDLLMKEFIYLNPKANPMSTEIIKRKLKKTKKELKKEKKRKNYTEEKIKECMEMISQYEEELNPLLVLARNVEESECNTEVVSQLCYENGILENKEIVVNVPKNKSSITTNTNPNQFKYSSFSKKIFCERWKYSETLKFYKALQKCGTDFNMIQRLFPKRTRQQIKNKFKAEQLRNFDLINEALNNKLPMELEDFVMPAVENIVDHC